MSAARFDLVVRGGIVAGETGVQEIDLGIRDGRIAARAPRLEDATRVLDAAGHLVLPGGVDAHCHMDQPAYGWAACADDFVSGTISAACGGTTTVIPFAMAGPEDALAVTVAAYRCRAEASAVIDFGIHPTIQAVPEGLARDVLPALARDGMSSWKIFTTYQGFALDDAAILDVLAAAARLGVLVMVHAENSALIAWRTRELLAAGKRAPRFHAEARPVLAEREAIHRVGSLAQATGAEVLIAHVSSAEGLAEIGRLRAGGARIRAETCPQYLLLGATDLERAPRDAARFMCSPPPRGPADHAALWAGIARSDIAIWASDHSPYRLDGPDGKLRHGPDSSFSEIANGLPGLELRLPILFSEGYQAGRIDLPRLVELACGAPARLHGIGDRKGSLEIGADADLALWDPAREVTATHAILHDRTGFTPYEGCRLKGWPVTVLSRGEIVVEDGRVLGTPGRGRFVAASWGERS